MRQTMSSGPAFRVLHLDVEVVALVEDAGVHELVLQLVPGPGPVLRDQVVVGELGLRVLVQPALVAVRRQVVEVEVVLLDVLAVVALGVGQAEEALLKNRVPLVPQRERQAQALLVVADSGQAVLAPPVGPGPRLVVTEVRPGVSVVAVVLADRPPLPFAEIRPPGPPRHTRPGLLEPALFCSQIPHPPWVTAGVMPTSSALNARPTQLGNGAGGSKPNPFGIFECFIPNGSVMTGVGPARLLSPLTRS